MRKRERELYESKEDLFSSALNSERKQSSSSNQIKSLLFLNILPVRKQSSSEEHYLSHCQCNPGSYSIE